MKVSETVGLVICFVLHFAALGFGIGWLVHKYVQTVRYPTRKRKPGISRLLVFSFFLIVSIWFLRLAVELFVSWYPLKDEDPRLNGVEAFFNSLVHALQTFSMDEDYTTYLVVTKELCRELTGSAGAAALLGGFMAVQGFLAPIVGGAMLLSLLSVALGLFMVANPFGTVTAMVTAVGVILIIEGAINLFSLLYSAVTVHHLEKLAARHAKG